MSYCFRRKYRLLKTDEYSSVFAFRKSKHNLFFQVLAAPNNLNYARLGLVVGKKTARLAHERNYIKRSIREWFRLNRHHLTHCDYVVRSKQKFSKNEQKEAIKALAALMHYGKARCPK